MSKRVIIIGGGIAGLAAGVYLKLKLKNARENTQVILLEKKDRVGGKLLTEQVGDFLVEGGPDSFLPEKYWTVQLARQLGLGSQLLPSNDEFKGTFIYSGGQLHQLPEGTFLMVPTMFWPLVKSSLISWPGKFRMGLDIFLPRKKIIEDESLSELVTRRLGRECLEKIAEPLVAGIHTSNPDNMSVLAIFPRFVEMEQRSRSLILGMVSAMRKTPKPDLTKPDLPKLTYFMSFVKGMQQLSDSCAAILGGDSIRTKACVEAIEPKGQGFMVHLENEASLEGEAVILATAAYEASAVIKSFDATLAHQLNAINWSSSATISLAFRKDDVRVPLKGFGFIIPRIEDRRINAVTWSSIKWSHRAPEDYLLMRAFVGGGHHEELVHELDDIDLVNTVLEELSSIAGLKADPKICRIFRWFRGMPKYTVGHLVRMGDLDREVAKHPGLLLIGCSYKGIGIGDCIHHAQINADKVLESLR